jgi:hypothetical protein
VRHADSPAANRRGRKPRHVAPDVPRLSRIFGKIRARRVASRESPALCKANLRAFGGEDSSSFFFARAGCARYRGSPICAA